MYIMLYFVAPAAFLQAFPSLW